MPARAPKLLRTRAIRLDQNADHPLYLFALSAAQLHEIADISRVSRDDAGHLIGYQRPEVKRHVAEIVRYLNGTEKLIFPNAINLSLSSDVRFTRSRGPQVENVSVAGILEIPLPREGEPKPGWIVDGQQRALALKKSKRTDFPVPITAFIADDVELQRDQFLRINNTRPLPRGLVRRSRPSCQPSWPLGESPQRSAKCSVERRRPHSRG